MVLQKRLEVFSKKDEYNIFIIDEIQFIEDAIIGIKFLLDNNIAYDDDNDQIELSFNKNYDDTTQTIKVSK